VPDHSSTHHLFSFALSLPTLLLFNFISASGMHPTFFSVSSFLLFGALGSYANPLSVHMRRSLATSSFNDSSYHPKPGKRGPLSAIKIHEGEKFFEGWKFYSDKDPTNGFVDYVNEETARSEGLIGMQDGAVVIRVSDKPLEGNKGRKSVRVETKETYTKGLFIMDAIGKQGIITIVLPIGD
jgi:hypothetical protein